jgi:hypothetical protein
VSAPEGRPAPTLFHDGIVVPAALCQDLGGALDLLEAFLRGTPPPLSAKAGRMPPAVHAVRVVAWRAAIDHRERQSLVFAGESASRPVVLAPAIAATPSAVEITTAQAATLLGRTEARVRQLATAGQLAGRKDTRNVWLLDRGSVLAYASRGSTRHDHSRDEQHGRPHPTGDCAA